MSVGTARTRERDLLSSVQHGQLEYFWPTKALYFSDAENGMHETCIDVVGNYLQANPFEHLQVTEHTPILNGELYSYGKLARQFRDYPVDYNVRAADSSADFPLPNLIQVGQEAAAKTNPSTAHVSIPTALAEMKDLPDLIHSLGWGFISGALQSKSLRKQLGQLTRREAKRTRKNSRALRLWKWLQEESYVVMERPKGDTWSKGTTGLPAIPVRYWPDAKEFREPLKRARFSQLIRWPWRFPTIYEPLRGLAAGNLTWRFAIAPVISDLKKMLNFQKAVDKRFQQLHRLKTRGLDRRRVGMGEDSFRRDEGVKTIQSRGAVVTFREFTDFTMESWATVEWQASWEGVKDPRWIENDWITARNLVFGITDFESFLTAWELMPWSWLSDWFTGTQNMISALNNTFGAFPREICYMRTTTSRKCWDRVSVPSWVRISGTMYAGEKRQIRIVIPVATLFMPTVSMPVLTHRQWSILGSLATIDLFKHL